MESKTAPVIRIEAIVNAPVTKVWDSWNNPEHITQWNSASDDWHTPIAKVDLRVGGSFTSRMEAKDGSMGFDFEGIYDVVTEYEYIEYTMSDGRKVKIQFIAEGERTKVIVSFDAESMNPVEMQEQGWQAILDNFKKYTEQL